jgi:hypothetical protein
LAKKGAATFIPVADFSSLKALSNYTVLVCPSGLGDMRFATENK